MKNKNLNKIIGIFIDIIVLVGILLFIGLVVFNLITEKVYIKKENNPNKLIKDTRSVQIMEVISEKIYSAFVEQDENKINELMGNFYNLNQTQINEISSNININEKNIDAKVLEIYDLGNNIYRIKNIYKKDDDYSYKMDGKKNIFVLKLNKNKGTFKVLDMKVGV